MDKQDYLNTLRGEIEECEARIKKVELIETNQIYLNSFIGELLIPTNVFGTYYVKCYLLANQNGLDAFAQSQFNAAGKVTVNVYYNVFPDMKIIPASDLPLYLGWEYKSPKFAKLIKNYKG
jgi:hypothetical protein